MYPGMVRHVRATRPRKRGGRVLAKGDYTLLASVQVAGATKQTSGAFTMLADGLAQEKASVVKMPLPATGKKQAIALEATITNNGNKAAEL